MKNPKVNIKNLRAYDQGWQWDQSIIDPAGIEHAGSYQTNVLGDGLWVVYENSQKQILGNMQFTLYGDRKQVYGQIRRFLIKQYRMED